MKTRETLRCALSVTSLTVLVGIIGIAGIGGCAPGPQVEGVKFSAPTPATTATVPTATGATQASMLQPTAAGGLAVRLLAPSTPSVVGRPIDLTLEYADAHGGLVGTVEDFGDGGIGGLKVSDCRDTEQNPSRGDKRLQHTWSAPGTYTISVTVTTLSCVHGQEDVTATAQVIVR